MRIIDADGHVAENPSLVIEAMKRRPQQVVASADGTPRLIIEGRNYPEDRGPGAGCPPEHGISTASNINCRSAEGMLGDADRDHISTMVLYPGLRGSARRASKTRSSLPVSPAFITNGSRTTAPRRAVGYAFAATTDRGDAMVLTMLARGCRAIRDLGTNELIRELT
jgi:hypothetical protein